jgi:CPA2 family monovalent cation:H+ antiporter-2
VLVGCGRVDSIVATALGNAGAPFVVIETDSDRVTELRDRGFSLLEGNAVSRDVMLTAGVARATQLVIAIPNAFEAGRIVEQARGINPGITIIARAHSDAEIGHLQGLGADTVIMGERQIALEMLSALGVTSRPVSS